MLISLRVLTLFKRTNVIEVPCPKFYREFPTVERSPFLSGYIKKKNTQKIPSDTYLLMSLEALWSFWGNYLNQRFLVPLKIIPNIFASSLLVRKYFLKIRIFNRIST